MTSSNTKHDVDSDTELQNTNLPWYRKEIGPRLRPDVRKFFETYSRIPSEDIEEHLHKIRDAAWKIKPYPCIGQWQFLTSITPTLPIYPAIIQRLQAGDSILDLGCCFGQDLRRLIADGAPATNMFGADLFHDFWELSFDLYHDKGRMNAEFIAADVLDSASELQSLKGRIDVVIIAHFLHLWDWDKQIEAAKNIVSVTKPGSWIIGYQAGSHLGKEFPNDLNTGSGIFLHNVETCEKFWKQVGEESGLELSVDASVCDMKDWVTEEDIAWMPTTIVGLQFNIRRLEGGH